MQENTTDKTRDFASFLTEENILCRTPISDRNELIMAILQRLAYTHGIGSVDAVFEAVQERENARATIVANGIAIPHARIDTIAKPLVAVATLPEGVVFVEDEPPVKLVFMVLVPKDRPALYLQIISALGQVCMSCDAADTCATMQTPHEILNFFKRGGMALPDFICAGDIMEKVAYVLHDNNSLKDAIDLFVAHGLVEVPVVDKDGDLVGIVSADALLKVCMPDYLLWMDDLSPIMNFEPFVNILRNEENTWLAEILHHDIPVVQVHQPAIAVAESMAKRNASVCYVAKDKRLMGVVTLPHFLNKVLRD